MKKQNTKKNLPNFEKELPNVDHNTSVSNNPDFNPYQNKNSISNKFLHLFKKEDNDTFVDISYKLKVSKNKLNMSRLHNRYYVITKLLLKSWIKSFWGPVGAFLLPIALIVFAFTINSNSPEYASGMLFQAISIGIVSINISSFPVQYVEYKKSSLLKRIVTTPLSRKEFLSSIIIFNLLVTISSIIVGHILVYAFFYSKFDFSSMNIINLIIGYILFLFPVLMLGVLIGSVSKSANWATGLGTLLFGIIIAFAIIIHVQASDGSVGPASGFGKFISIVRFFLPFSFGQKIMLMGYYRGYSMHIEWYEYIIPIIYSVLLIGIIAKLFNRDI